MIHNHFSNQQRCLINQLASFLNVYTLNCTWTWKYNQSSTYFCAHIGVNPWDQPRSSFISILQTGISTLSLNCNELRRIFSSDEISVIGYSMKIWRKKGVRASIWMNDWKVHKWRLFVSLWRIEYKGDDTWVSLSDFTCNGAINSNYIIRHGTHINDCSHYRILLMDALSMHLYDERRKLFVSTYQHFQRKKSNWWLISKAL